MDHQSINTSISSNVSCCLLLYLSLTQANAVNVNALFSNTQTGDGTYYGVSNAGNCRLDGAHTPTWVTAQNLVTVAINEPQYGVAATCGLCVEITGGAGSGANPISSINGGQPFIAYVDNKCPECSSGDLDLGLAADGRWDITWKAVECPVADTSISYFFESSQAYYIKVQPTAGVLPVASMKIKVGGSWKPGTKTDDNFFTFTGFTSAVNTNDPLHVELTSTAGEVVRDQIYIVSMPNDVRISSSLGGRQFSKSGSTGSVPTKQPTKEPTRRPTRQPTKSPDNGGGSTKIPTKHPANQPTTAPTGIPLHGGGTTTAPTEQPTRKPTRMAGSRRRRRKRSIKRKLKQQLTLDNLETAWAYNKNKLLKKAYELGYGLSIGIVDVTSTIEFTPDCSVTGCSGSKMAFKPGCTVTSSAEARRSVTIAFTAEISEELIQNGEVKESVLEHGATAGDLAADIALVKTVAEYSNVRTPTELEILTVSEADLDDCDDAECTPTLEEDASETGAGEDNTGLIVGLVVGLIGGLAMVAVAVVLLVKLGVLNMREAVDLKEVDLQNAGSTADDTNKGAGLFGESVERSSEDLAAPLSPKSQRELHQSGEYQL